MKKVSVSELKNKLSQYLRYVKAGERVVIVDRNTPIAHLSPMRSVHMSANQELAELEAKGIIRRGNAGGLKTFPFPQPDESSGVLDALLDERGMGR